MCSNYAAVESTQRSRIIIRGRYNIQHGTTKSIRRRTREQKDFIPQIVDGLGKAVLPSIVNGM